MQSLQNTMSRALFLNQFGHLPGPNPKLFTQKGISYTLLAVLFYDLVVSMQITLM